MEPDRFDDVELQVLEEPTPRGPRRSTRWAIAVVAALLSAGTLAAGAAALTGSSDVHARPVARPDIDAVHAVTWDGATLCQGRERGSEQVAPLE